MHKIISSSFPDFKEVSVIEIGCGIGRITEFIAKDFKKVIGIDISGEMISKCKKRLKHQKNIAYYETDGKTLPSSDNSIDFVFSFIVFQHMPDKKVIRKNFMEVNRILKKFPDFKRVK